MTPIETSDRRVAAREPATRRRQRRWDRVLAIWLDGVRAPAVSQLLPLPD
jgi:hypothetical protein